MLAEIETDLLTRKEFFIKHRYTKVQNRTITITGENIIGLRCNGLKITSLNVSNSVSLEYLYCSDNQLINLDVSRNVRLKNLECDRNQLTSLNFSNNTCLSRVCCSHNQLSYKALNDMYETLNDMSAPKSVLIADNPGALNSDLCIAWKKEWRVHIKYGVCPYPFPDKWEIRPLD